MTSDRIGSIEPAQIGAAKRLRRISRVAAAGALIAMASAGCGGSGSNDGNGAAGFGRLSASVLWQQSDDGVPSAVRLSGTSPNAGFGTELPAAVGTVRLDFAPSAGGHCCVAIDPTQLTVDPSTGRRRIILTKIAPGLGSLTIAGFPGDVASQPAGALRTCELEPASAASPCVTDSLDTPSFLSQPTAVQVRAGAVAEAGDIQVPAIPFIITETLRPRPASRGIAPLPLGVTIAIAANDLPIEQVAIATTPGESVPIDLSPCDDRSATPCSSGGRLEVRGVRADGISSNIPAGTATIDIVANGGNTPALRLSYAFTVAAMPTPTTQGATATHSAGPAATATSMPSPPPVATATPRASATSIGTSTPSPTFTQRAPTATPDARCGAMPAQRCRQNSQANRSTLVLQRADRATDNRLAFDWQRGSFIELGEFGDPEFRTSYALCIYDQVNGNTTLVTELFVPPGVDCLAAECWTPTDNGFRYRDPGGGRDGVEQIDLRGGLPLRTEIRFRAGGRNLPLPALPLRQNQTVIVQLKNDFEEGKCWEARFSRPAVRNTSTTFRDSGDPPSADGG